jgi:membrane-bound serine protease (ClpP class)
MRSLFIALLILISSICHAARPVYVLSITDAINPAVADYIHRGLEKANKEWAESVVITLDTAGGMEKSTQMIVKDILASSTPVIAYVDPAGAYAAQEGLFLLYASSIAAMAPNTYLGLPPNKSLTDDNIKYHFMFKAFKQKAINDAIVNIHYLADLRHRNGEWAAFSFRNHATLSANDALKNNVINVVADDVPQLLQKIHNKTIDPENIKIWEPDWRYKIILFFTNPLIAYFLLLIGILAIFFAFLNPKKIAWGFLGAICLIITYYTFSLLPTSFFGLTLVLIGIACMIGEISLPKYGIVGTGGIISFIIGSMLLLDINSPGYYLTTNLLLLISIPSASLFFLILLLGIKRKMRRNS